MTTVSRALPPVVVSVSPPEAGSLLASLLQDYLAVLDLGADESKVTIEPVDDTPRSIVVFRVIQASRTVAARYPDAAQFLHTEEGSRRRLPPPTL